MKKKGWDNLSTKDRFELLDEIRKNFVHLFESIRQKYYPDTTSGIRLFLAKRLFSKLHNEFINKTMSEIQNVILSENRIGDLKEY